MPTPNTFRSLSAVVLPPLLLALVLTAACYVVSGPLLGTFFGGVLVATFLAPPLVLWRDDARARVMIAASIIDGVAIVWLLAVVTRQIAFRHWLAAYVLLTAYVAALCGIAIALKRARFSDVASAAVTMTLALAWLTWPVWLSRGLTPEAASWLVPAHPPLALNGLLLHLGVWGEGRVAYRLTNLGQDVPYQLPATIVPALLLHALLGGGLLLLAHRRNGAAIDIPDGDPG